MRQINIFDFLDDKDWIDKTYIVWKALHKGEWTEYSPKFLDYNKATEWRLTKGEDLFQKFGRELKRFTCRPSDNKDAFTIYYFENDEKKKKLVPGCDLGDAYANLILFTDIDPDSISYIDVINVIKYTYKPKVVATDKNK